MLLLNKLIINNVQVRLRQLDPLLRETVCRGESGQHADVLREHLPWTRWDRSAADPGHHL